MTLRLPSSRSPHSTSAVTVNRQLFAPKGRRLKYPSAGAPQPSVTWTFVSRGWELGLPSFQTRICDSRWKQSAYRAVTSCAHVWLRSTSARLASRTSSPTGT